MYYLGAKVKIVTLQCADGTKHYYANCMVNGVYYQKKNLTKYFGSRTLKQAKEHLEDAKSLMRKGINPFNNSLGDKIKDIVLAHIDSKKHMGKPSAYTKSLEGFYYNYVDPVIGHLKMEKVGDTHVQKIMKSLDGYAKEYKQNLQILMFRIFEKEFRKGNIPHNPCYDLDYGKHKKVPDFDIRLNESIEDTARKLYRTVLSFNEKYRLFLLMTVMLVRRVGETHKLKYGNIQKSSDGDWYIIVKNDITKTKIDEKYPLPIEVIKLLPEDILNKENEEKKLFNFSEGGISLNWNKLTKEAKIDINNGYKFTSHDCRKMFISILSFSGTNSDLADRCLSHSQGGIKHTYLDVPYRIRREIFENWWKFLRTNKNSIQTETATHGEV